MNNIEKLFDDLKSDHYEDIDIYLDKAIKEYNLIMDSLIKIELIENKYDGNDWEEIDEARKIVKETKQSLNVMFLNTY